MGEMGVLSVVMVLLTVCSAAGPLDGRWAFAGVVLAGDDICPGAPTGLFWLFTLFRVGVGGWW